MVPDLIEFSTILLVPGIQPGGFDASDFPRLGEPVGGELSIRTPVLSTFRFPAHLVSIEDPKVQVAAPQPTQAAVERLVAAVRDFVDDYVGRKGVRSLGHNLKFRRRHPDGFGKTAVLEAIVSPDVYRNLDSSKAPEASVELLFQPPFATSGRVRIEPSRVDDLDAVYFSFNYHFELAGDEDAYSGFVTALEHAQHTATLADETVNSILVGAIRGGDAGNDR